MTDPATTAAFEERYFEEIYRSDYDRRNPRYKHRSYLSEVQEHRPGGALLDVGCALGAFLREARERFDCRGIDVSNHAIGIATERLPGLPLRATDVLQYEPDTPFDVITSFDVLEHVPELDLALQRIRGWLAPEGVLVVSVPVYDTFVGWLVGKVDTDPTHIHCTSRYRWLERLQAAGYDVVDWKGILRFYARGLPYLHHCARWARRWSPAVLIVVRPKQMHA